MDIEKRLDAYRSDYLFHIDFKEKTYARMVIFSVFVTACITANFSMQDTLMKLGTSQLTLVMVLWGIGAIVLIVVIINFICITSLKSDEWVNSNTEMEDYRDELRQHFVSCAPNSNETEINNYVNEQFTLYLIGQYSNCSTIYYENNIFRQKSLLIIANATYLLLILTFIVSLFFMYQKFQG